MSVFFGVFFFIAAGIRHFYILVLVSMDLGGRYYLGQTEGLSKELLKPRKLCSSDQKGAKKVHKLNETRSTGVPKSAIWVVVQTRTLCNVEVRVCVCVCVCLSSIVSYLSPTYMASPSFLWSSLGLKHFSLLLKRKRHLMRLKMDKTQCRMAFFSKRAF